jgi:hypothetical protein
VLAELTVHAEQVSSGALSAALRREQPRRVAVALQGVSGKGERPALMAGEPLLLFSISGDAPTAACLPAKPVQALQRLTEALRRHPPEAMTTGPMVAPGFFLPDPEGAHAVYEVFLPGEWLWEEEPHHWRARLLLADRPFLERLSQGLGSPIAREGEFPIVLAERMIEEWTGRVSRLVEEAARCIPAKAEEPLSKKVQAAFDSPQVADVLGLPGPWPRTA